MGSKSDYLENKILDHVLKNTSYSAPSTIYAALFTATPSDTGGGTEVSGGSYTRATATFATSASGGSIANTNIITYPTATANWGTITSFGLFDASTSGNLLYWGDLNVSKIITSGDTVSFSVGSLVISED